MQESWVRSLGGDKALGKYSCLENSMDRGTWQARVHGVAKSQTQLSTNTQPINNVVIVSDGQQRDSAI